LSRGGIGIVEVALGEESAEEVEGAEGLVERSLVTGTLDGGEGVGIEVLDVAGGGSVDEPGGPRLHVLPVELCETGLVLGEGYGGDVDISRIDKHGELSGEELRVVRHHGGTGDGVVDVVGAWSPLSGAGMDSPLHIRAHQIVESAVTWNGYS